MAKIRTVFLIRLLAAFAVVFMAVRAYADCGNKCGQSCRSSCNNLAVEKNTHLDYCSRTDAQPTKTERGKCSSFCCISSPLTAAAREKSYAFDNRNSDSAYENIITANSGITLTTVVLSPNPPCRWHNSAQAVLCVFII